jgi:chemotaxis protein CheY-P-specific phosphatase CheC
MQQAMEKLRLVFPQVLQKQIFMFAEEMPMDDLPVEEKDWVEAQISFSGPIIGEMILTLPKSIELEIAANFLGKDVDDPELVKFSDDALKEILNVLCGHMLTALLGEEPIFDLSIPKVLPLSQEKYSGLADRPNSVGFDVEGKPAVLSFTTFESIAASKGPIG